MRSRGRVWDGSRPIPMRFECELGSTATEITSAGPFGTRWCMPPACLSYLNSLRATLRKVLSNAMDTCGLPTHF